eukprot:5496856-Prymnesium_polylepis.2
MAHAILGHMPHQTVQTLVAANGFKPVWLSRFQRLLLCTRLTAVHAPPPRVAAATTAYLSAAGSEGLADLEELEALDGKLCARLIRAARMPY